MKIAKRRRRNSSSMSKAEQTLRELIRRMEKSENRPFVLIEIAKKGL